VPDKIERLDQTFLRLAKDDAAFDDESREDCALDWNNVAEHLAKHTANYRKWGLLAELAQKQHNEMEDELERVRCDCRQRARQHLEGNNIKVTEGRVDEIATLDGLYQSTLRAYRAVQHIYERFRRMEKTMESHRAMVQSLNSRQTRERNWDTHPTPPESWDEQKSLYQQQKGERSA